MLPWVWGMRRECDDGCPEEVGLLKLPPDSSYIYTVIFDSSCFNELDMLIIQSLFFASKLYLRRR